MWFKIQEMTPWTKSDLLTCKVFCCWPLSFFVFIWVKPQQNPCFSHFARLNEIEDSIWRSPFFFLLLTVTSAGPSPQTPGEISRFSLFHVRVSLFDTERRFDHRSAPRWFRRNRAGAGCNLRRAEVFNLLLTCVCFRERYWPARSRRILRYDSPVIHCDRVEPYQIVDMLLFEEILMTARLLTSLPFLFFLSLYIFLSLCNLYVIKLWRTRSDLNLLPRRGSTLWSTMCLYLYKP